MMRKLGFVVLIFTLVMAALACRIPWAADPLPTETQPPDQAPANTSTAMPTATSTSQPIPSLPIFDDPVIFNFQFFTPSNGWAVTQGGNYLLVTEDGGQTWLDTTPTELDPLPTGITSLSIESFFLDEDTAWFTPQAIADTFIYHTRDGGRNWDSTPVPFDNARYFF